MVYGGLISFKGDIMLTRIFLKIACIFIIYLAITSVSHGSEIASEPIIEGKSIAGLNIGDTEDKVILVLSRGLFKLYGVEGNLKTDDKLISFGDMTEEGGLGINVLLRNGKVVTIQVISALIKGEYPYKGKTKKGFAFGDTFQKIEQIYGKPHKDMGIYLYKEEGIAFTVVYGAIGTSLEKPNTIFIMSPASDLELKSMFER
jgi:hypothetical protein